MADMRIQYDEKEGGITPQMVGEFAKKLGKSRPGLVKWLLTEALTMGPELVERLQTYAPHLSAGEVLRGFVIKRLAEEEADAEVWGKLPRQLPELMQEQTTAGVRAIPFNELYLMLKKTHLNRELPKKEQIIRRAIAAKLAAGIDTTQFTDDEIAVFIGDQRAAQRAQQWAKLAAEDEELGARLEPGALGFNPEQWKADIL